MRWAREFALLVFLLGRGARGDTNQGGGNQVIHTKYLARSRRTSYPGADTARPYTHFQEDATPRMRTEDEPKMAQRYPSAARSWLVHQAGMFSVE